MKEKAFLTFIASLILTGCYGSRPVNLTVETACPASLNCVSSLAKQSDKKIEPFLLKNKQTSWKNLIKFIEDQPRVIIVFSNDMAFHAEFRTKWLRFVDDVVVRHIGMEVDIRSSSRVGYSDFGANRKRVEYLREQLKSANIID